jgi:hypothetical protein
MPDSTTEGYPVSAAEIEGMVRNLCAYALGEPDPLRRYEDLTHQQVLFDGMVAAIQRQRGRALADLMVAGSSVEKVVAATNLTTVAQVRKLIKVADETERVKAATAVKPADRRRAKAAAVEPAADPAVEPSAEPAAEAAPVEEAVAGPVAQPFPAVAFSDRRVMTAADRLALGLPVDGAGSRERPRPRRVQPAV